MSDYEYGDTGNRMPLLDLADTVTPGKRDTGKQISEVMTHLRAMRPGWYGDVRTGHAADEYVTVVRVNEEDWKLTYIRSRRSYQGPDLLFAARFIRAEITTRVYLRAVES